MTQTTEELDLVSNETDRQARRRGVREKAAKAEIALAPIKLWQADLEGSRRRADAAADLHAAETTPLQDELSLLEQRAVSRIGLREPPDTEEDDKRAEIISLLHRHNGDLEEAVEREQKIQNELLRKIRVLQMQHDPPAVTLLALGRLPLSSPRLEVRSFVLQRQIEFASARVAAAEKGLGIATHNVEAIANGTAFGNAAGWTLRLECWRAELAAAQKSAADLLAESNAIHRAKMDE